MHHSQLADSCADDYNIDYHKVDENIHEQQKLLPRSF